MTGAGTGGSRCPHPSARDALVGASHREAVAALVEGHEHGVAVADVAREQRPREAVVDLALHEPAQRPGPVQRVVAALGEPGARVPPSSSVTRLIVPAAPCMTSPAEPPSTR